MMDIFEERDKDRMCDEIAAFFREEHDLELGVIGTGKILDFFRRCWGTGSITGRWMMRNGFMAGMRIIWKPIITHCIKM